MSVLEVEVIGANRYAPAGYNAVCLYGMNDAKGLTLGQMIAAVFIDRASSLEHASVTKANQVSQTSGMLKALAESVELELASSTSKLSSVYIDLEACDYTPYWCSSYTTLYDFLTKEVGLSVEDDVSTYTKKMTLFESLSEQIEDYSNQSKELAIDLQSWVNRREVAYNTGSTVLGCIMNGAAQMASNF